LPFQTQCPYCEREMALADKWLDELYRCPICKHRFVARAGSGLAPLQEDRKPRRLSSSTSMPPTGAAKPKAPPPSP